MVGTDLFLSHNWGEKPYINHERVKIINAELNERGYVTWFDETHMHGDVTEEMAEGIEETKGVLVFITEEYHDKVNNRHSPNDNCRREFSHAIKHKTSTKMIPIVMDPPMRDTSKWKGILSMGIGNKLYIDMSGDLSDYNYLKEQMDKLEEEIKALGIKGAQTAKMTSNKMLASKNVKSISRSHEIDQSYKEAVEWARAGKVPEAIDLFEKALEKSISILGESHHTTIDIAKGLGRCFYISNKFEKAIAVFDKIIKKCNKDDPVILNLMHEKACCYMKLNKNENEQQRTKILLQEVLEKREKVLGSCHKDTLISKVQLSILYRQMFKQKEAIQILEEIFPVFERVFGKNDPDTFTMISLLAFCYRMDMQFDKSIPLYEDLVSRSVTTLGPTDKRTEEYEHLLKECIKIRDSYCIVM